MATFTPSSPISTPHKQLKLTNKKALCCPSSPLQKIHGHGFTKAVAAFSLKTSLSGALRRRRVLKASSVEVKATSQTKKASIQFIQGTDEQTVPDVRLTKSKDGLDGVATFTFTEPSVFDSSRELGDITGMYMIDEEGVLRSVDVTAKFINGRPSKIEAKYVMRSSYEWDRFMRFMERYGEENGLQFVKK